MGFKFIPLSTSFDKNHSDDYALICHSDNRCMLPRKKPRQVKPALRDEAVDFGDNAYDARIITVKAALCCEDMLGMRKSLREIAYWLSHKGRLIFDDEPDVYYIGQLFTPLLQNEFALSSEVEISFVCEPFAFGAAVTHNGTLDEGFAQSIQFEYEGTRQTPFKLIIKNTGDYIADLEILIGG